jgi:hypothetical protein
VQAHRERHYMSLARVRARRLLNCSFLLLQVMLRCFAFLLSLNSFCSSSFRPYGARERDLWGERERWGRGGGGGEREIYWEMLHNRGSRASLAHTRADTGLSAQCDDSVKRDLLHCEKRPIIVERDLLSCQWRGAILSAHVTRAIDAACDASSV